VDEKRGELEGKAVLQILAARMLLALRLKKVVGWKERESRYYSGRDSVMELQCRGAYQVIVEREDSTSTHHHQLENIKTDAIDT
jgi:hypothetical protein